MPAWTEPRRAPRTTVPTIAGAFVLVVALVLFLVLGWPVTGWVIGVVLWVASEAFGRLLARQRGETGNLAGAGVAAFGMFFRAIAVMAVFFIVAVSDKTLGLAAALTYAAAYTATLGLSLSDYFAGPKAGTSR
jgi:hypothetical protein